MTNYWAYMIVVVLLAVMSLYTTASAVGDANEADAIVGSEGSSRECEFNVNDWLASEVIWAAVLASFIAFAGVGISNRANRKCLLLQLGHDAQQRSQERQLGLRRDVYLEGAEAIAEAIRDIQLIPNRCIAGDYTAIGARVLPALAKIHMVGTFETIQEATRFMELFNRTTLPIVPEVSRMVVLRQEIGTLNEIGTSQVRELDELNRRFQQLQDGGADDSTTASCRTLFEQTNERYGITIRSLEEKGQQVTELYAQLVSKCIQTSSDLQKGSLGIILSIRRELGLEIDVELYLSTMNAAFQSNADVLKPDSIRKLILPDR